MRIQIRYYRKYIKSIPSISHSHFTTHQSCCHKYYVLVFTNGFGTSIAKICICLFCKWKISLKTFYCCCCCIKIYFVCFIWSAESKLFRIKAKWGQKDAGKLRSRKTKCFHE